MRSPLFLSLLILGGCSKHAVPLRVTSFRQMSSADTEALAAGTYPKPMDSVIACTPASQAAPFTALTGRGYEVDITYLRNPGVNVWIVHGPPGKPLNLREQTEAASLLKRNGATVSPTIPIRYGPDGRTPIVLLSGVRYSPKDQNIGTRTTTRVTFPSLIVARQATRYIGKPYVVKVGQEKGKAFLEASATMPYGAATDEFDAFKPIASKFGGHVEWVGN